jgi:hypothetical protein
LPVRENRSNERAADEGARFEGLPMPDQFLRVVALLAAVAALLCAGFHFHQGDIVATLYFMTSAILVTAVTHLSVRKGLI